MAGLAGVGELHRSRVLAGGEVELYIGEAVVIRGLSELPQPPPPTSHTIHLPLVARNASGSPPPAPSFQAVPFEGERYYRLGGAVVGWRVGSSAESVVYWLHGDHLGSIVRVTDETGEQVLARGYDAWGEMAWATGTLTLTLPLGYTGRRFDEATGLLYLRARWYYPGLGRFVSADTIVPQPGNPQDFNRYSYAANSPLRYTDPSGHCIPGYNCPGDKGQNDPIVGGIWMPPTPHEGPGRGPLDRDKAYIWSGLATVADVIGWGTSLTGAFVEIVALAAGQPEVGLAAYQALEPFDKVSAGGSLVFTALADRYGGYTYRDTDAPHGYTELVIGQDTTLDVAYNSINMVWSEGIGDAGVNTVEFATQHADLWGGFQEPTWELRIRPMNWDGVKVYVLCYDNCGSAVLQIIRQIIPVYEYGVDYGE